MGRAAIVVRPEDWCQCINSIAIGVGLVLLLVMVGFSRPRAFHDCPQTWVDVANKEMRGQLPVHPSVFDPWKAPCIWTGHFENLTLHSRLMDEGQFKPVFDSFRAVDALGFFSLTMPHHPMTVVATYSCGVFQWQCLIQLAPNTSAPFAYDITTAVRAKSQPRALRVDDLPKFGFLAYVGTYILTLLLIFATVVLVVTGTVAVILITVIITDL